MARRASGAIRDGIRAARVIRSARWNAGGDTAARCPYLVWGRLSQPQRPGNNATADKSICSAEYFQRNLRVGHTPPHPEAVVVIQPRPNP